MVANLSMPIADTLQEFYRKCRLPTKHQLEWDDATSRIRYSYLQTLLPLQKKLATLSSQFPESLEAYHAMHNNHDMQLKVARFLMGGNMRDAMLSDFGWAWRQVKPLIDIFDRDVSIFVLFSSLWFCLVPSSFLDLDLKFYLAISRPISGQRFRDMSRTMRYGIPGNGLRYPRVCELDKELHSNPSTPRSSS